MTDSILSLTEFNADAGRWLNQIRQQPDHLILTENGRACAVVQDFDHYQAQQQAILLLKLMAQGEAEVQAGRLSPQKEVFARLRGRIKEQCTANG